MYSENHQQTNDSTTFEIRFSVGNKYYVILDYRVLPSSMIKSYCNKYCKWHISLNIWYFYIVTGLSNQVAALV